MEFIQNKGQWGDNIHYKAKLPAGNIYLEKNEITYQFYDEQGIARLDDLHHHRIKNPSEKDYLLDLHAFKLTFLNANTENILAEEPTSDYVNYYLGNDRSKWASNVKKYNKIQYQNLYPGIDLKYYLNGDNLKYDFIIAPKVNTNQIRIEYTGQGELFIKRGKLILKTSVNQLEEQEPYAYQIIDGEAKEVTCNFELIDNVLSFSFPKGYDDTQELIIDPTLVFASYSGSTADNWGYTSTFDEDGHLYGGGVTFGVGYPTTIGAYQINFNGGNDTVNFGSNHYLNGTDITISKFSSNGTNLIYSTYLGGSENESPHSLIVNNNNELLVLGTTSSPDFPVSVSAYDTTYNGGNSYIESTPSYTNGSDIFITKLSSNGSALLSSTYIGGTANDGLNTSPSLKYNYADEFRGEIIVDSNDNVYVASSTNSTDFPVTPGVFQSSLSGMQDGCVFKLNANLSTLIWSSFIGGTNDDAAYSMQFSSTGEVLVTGGTDSPNFPVTAGSLNTMYQNFTDGWVSKINNSATAIIASTFLGTPEYDQSYFVQLDTADNVYVIGQTEGTYQIIPSTVYNNPNSGQFVHKLNPDLSTTIFSTTFGTSSGEVDIALSAFLVNVCNNILISGWGGALNSSYAQADYSTTNGLPITPNAIQPTTDGNDYYLMMLAEDADTLLYATFFGGNASSDHVDGGTSRFDKKGIVYQAVCSSCGLQNTTDFPTTPGAWSTTDNSSNCNLGVFKMDLTTLDVDAELYSGPVHCLGDSTYFQNLTNGGVSFYWDFDDGHFSTEFEPVHLYTDTGTYNVMLVVLDAVTCLQMDTDYVEVKVVHQPYLSIGVNNTIETNWGPTLQLVPNTDGITYSWTPEEGLSCFDCPHPIVTTNESTTFYLTVRGEDGCFSYDSIAVIFDGSIYVPNSFTPDGDGKNDVFYAFGKDIVEFEMHIFNRWGEKIFYSDDMTIGWDGLFEGSLSQTETYVWKVKFTDKRKDSGELYGTVTLIR